MKFFGKLGGPHDLAVSMVGLKLGDTFLQMGCGDGGLLAALAAKVGLTGRACAVDDSEAGVARGTQGAARGGVLVEIAQAPYDRLPHDSEAFDVVVLNDLLGGLAPEPRAAGLREAQRVLRPGGRLLIVEGIGRSGLAALIGRRPPDAHYVASGGAEAALKAAGFAAVRTLSERAGLRFVEAVRPR
jgi:SAM-dependent methyltransferase